MKSDNKKVRNSLMEKIKKLKESERRKIKEDLSALVSTWKEDYGTLLPPIPEWRSSTLDFINELGDLISPLFTPELSSMWENIKNKFKEVEYAEGCRMMEMVLEKLIPSLQEALDLSLGSKEEEIKKELSSLKKGREEELEEEELREEEEGEELEEEELREEEEEELEEEEGEMVVVDLAEKFRGKKEKSEEEEEEEDKVVKIKEERVVKIKKEEPKKEVAMKNKVKVAGGKVEVKKREEKVEVPSGFKPLRELVNKKANLKLIRRLIRKLKKEGALPFEVKKIGNIIYVKEKEFLKFLSKIQK